MLGVVKWFNDQKGFGFITDENNKDVFVHFSDVESNGFKTLFEGDEVQFEVEKTEKGLKATKVIKK